MNEYIHEYKYRLKSKIRFYAMFLSLVAIYVANIYVDKYSYSNVNHIKMVHIISYINNNYINIETHG